MHLTLLLLLSESLIITALVVCTSAAFEADRVPSMPDMGNFTSYGFFSGYLDIDDTKSFTNAPNVVSNKCKIIANRVLRFYFITWK